MQLTMNNDQATVSAAKVNRFGNWISAVTKKVTSLFKKTKKETPKFTFSTVTEGISFIEWRTWYDQQRIVKTVETIAATKTYPELCKALGIHYQALPKVATKVVLTDNNFDRRMIKLFNFEGLNPQTQALLLGGETKAQKLPRTPEFEKMFLQNISTRSQVVNNYEGWWLREFALELNAIQVAIDVPEIEQPALLALPATEEVIEVSSVTESQKITEQHINVEPVETEIVTLSEAEKLEKTIKGLRKLSLSDLKTFAKANDIHIRGKMTQITSIREKIIRELRKKAAS